MVKNKIKVVWVCHLSNEEIRERLHFKTFFLKKKSFNDFAKWNTNAINEFKNYNDVELHIISPHISLTLDLDEFVMDGIHYHFFRSEDDHFIFKLKRKIFKGEYLTPEYEYNTNVIIQLIKTIKPNLIHVIGAENPYYSKSALSMPKDIPLIVALQTLMISPDFYKNYPISKELYEYRSSIERKVLSRADYISCRGQRFVEILNKEIIPTPKILDLPLAVGENIEIAEYKKEFDFVYFAKDIEKAIDWTIETFALVQKKYPELTLNVIGGYSNFTKEQLDKRLKELNIINNVIFSGTLPTHDDVINQVRKSRFAILPLKVDLISGTIREAMANGLPVITTITPATPKLNEIRESVLLSPKGDFKAMAENIFRLLSDIELAKDIRMNAYETLKEKYDNKSIIKCWHDTYFELLNNVTKVSHIQ